jgi:hypothetical protein
MIRLIHHHCRQRESGSPLNIISFRASIVSSSNTCLTKIDDSMRQLKKEKKTLAIKKKMRLIDGIRLTQTSSHMESARSSDRFCD